MPESELKLSEKQLFSIIFGPENRSIFWFTFWHQRRVTHSCSSLHQSDLALRKNRPKIMVVRIGSAQTRRCLHGNQDTCHPAHVEQIFKKMPRAGLASTPLSLPQLRPEMASRPALCASAGAPVLAIPRTQNRTPPPSKIGPRRTRKPKIREQFSVPFSGPFSGPENGVVFWI